MPLQITPSTGVSVGQVFNSLNPTKQAPIGTVIKYDDGHDYVFATASAAIAAGPTVVILTEPAFTMATGAGAWTYTGTVALAIGDKAWFRKTAI
jgi:hypothetical protein